MVFEDFVYWNKSNKLRFLQASGWSYLKTIENAKNHNFWRESTLKLVHSEDLQGFTEDIFKFLTSGILYLHGRDCRFRPIFVLNAYKIDFNKVNEDAMILGISYFLEVVINSMLLPGQVENWVIILDFNNMSLFSISILVKKKKLNFQL